MRQVSEELEEMRNEYGSASQDDEPAYEPRMWGRRHGGLRGPRPADDHAGRESPNVVLARFTSGSSSTGRSGYDSPLRLPIDTSFVSPSTNIPEDIESSRASSILELPLVEDPVTGE